MDDKLLVRDLMTANVLAMRPSDDLVALRDLMLDHHVRHVPVVESDGELVGLVSHRDLLRSSLIEQTDTPRLVQDAVLVQLTVRDVMTTSPDTVEPDTDIREAAQLMFENKYGCVPVVEGTHLVGILTESDFVRFLARGT